MSDRTEFLHPDFEPGEFDRIERELRRSLSQEADRVRPADRLQTILHEAQTAGPVTATGGAGVRRWLVPAAAAAVVAVIAGGVWMANQDPGVTPAPPVAQTSASTPATPTASDQPTTPSTSASATSGSGATVMVALPAYFVGPIGDAVPTYKLFREFVRTPLPAGATDAQRVTASLDVAMQAQPFGATDGYLQPWSGTSVTAATVTTDAIEVQLSGPGTPGPDAETARLAVQELVWTAQAAAQKTLPVRFEVADGSTLLFGSIPTDRSFTRPAADEAWQDLAPIWITAPGRDQVVPSSSPVQVKGDASVFEATVSWELSRDATRVADGHTMATIGAPGRGTYSFSLGRLTPGTYSVKVYEASPKDGSVSAADTITFTVR